MDNSNTQIANSLYGQCIADFELRAAESNSTEPAELTALREKAFQQFKITGFPSTRVEDWKYTNLAPFLKESFITDAGSEGVSLRDEVLDQAAIPGLDAYRIVLVNGQYSPDLSDKIAEEGVYVFPMSAAVSRPAFKKHFGQYTDLAKTHFAAVNTALFRDGLFIEVKNNIVVEKPLHVIHVTAADDHTFLQPRHLMVVGISAGISVIESFVTTNEQAAVFINNVSEVFVAENAQVQHYYIQTGRELDRYVHHTEVFQQSNSIYNNYKASFPGASLLRNNLHIALDGENVESHLYGLYLTGGRQLVDNHTVVDHRKPHCQSNELYKGVLKDESTGVFNGKVFVREDAQKTNAFQQNNNLMLSRKAVIDSKPQLEIFADDVKCSHGSTVGQFNAEALFYLKSRGIGEEKAKALLIHAFAYDVTEKIPIPEVQAHINHLIEEGLK
ncbi:MAG: Fe-S cluster assembly protein SufD [Candidatus Pseudobacter hemicellulosilyticus]|uniref:Fe-S cluster assembly protein SufD n=1 Tax=Candidatus Pseudobacter hemicellulosilyticus TaxID=3121375 RepID=A0AAJ6BH00_9BACT|nr:MAG: Fe-S cluster assembly protein SufD [Pseudobacter sp.]